MPQLEFLPDWIYTFLILPIAVLFQRHFHNGNRITVLETNQENYMKKVDKMCKSNDDLAKSINQMIGRLDEHLRNTE